MIVNDRLTSYLHSLDSRESEIIEAIGRESVEGVAEDE